VKTDEFKKRYQKRAGVEGTISQGVRSCGLRRTRYVGLAKAHLQNILTAAAIDLARFFSWVSDHPIASTRQSRFASLACPAT
jgi:transposase